MPRADMPSDKLAAEYADIMQRAAWPRLFQGINRECEKFDYSTAEARLPKNKLLNRYRDVNPYDHSRVILQRGTQDYINANYVQVEKASRKYILTQGPLPNTVSHFWLMVFEQNSRVILMLNKTIEKMEIKCHWYWPTDVGWTGMLKLPEVGLTVEQLAPAEDFVFYTTRLFRVEDTESGESRDITQYHYTTWPDFGVPSSPHAFLQFLMKVRASGGLEPTVGPAIVHCSAGIGRSGTFCLVDSCLLLLEKDGEESLDIQKILLEMRRGRMGLIQTPDQLRFSYEAIIEGTKRLASDWIEPENIYNEVVEDEDVPPPPPPRGMSLPFIRPLPAIPVSTSLPEYPHLSSSESEESEDSDADDDSSDSNLSEENIPVPTNRADEEALRRRMNQENLAARVEQIRQNQRKAERWIGFKKSILKPVSVLSVGVIVFGIIYACIKH